MLWQGWGREELPCAYKQKSVEIKVEVHGETSTFFGSGEEAAITPGLTSLILPSLPNGGPSQSRAYKKQADVTQIRYWSQ